MRLTVYQREILRMEAGAVRGDCATTRKGIKVLDTVELSREERERVGYVVTAQGTRWDDAEYRAEVVIGDIEAAELAVRLIRERIIAMEMAERWDVAALREMLDLAEQMHVDFEACIAEARERRDAQKVGDGQEEAVEEVAEKPRAVGRRKKR